MKKTTKRLLLSIERVRDLQPQQLRGVVGGVNPTTADPNPPSPVGCADNGHGTDHCGGTNAGPRCQGSQGNQQL